MIKRNWITKLKDRTPEWLEFRKSGIGASEIGIICGVNPYRPTPMELYHQKVGTEVRDNILNEAMFFGIELEKFVADKWEYYDGVEGGYILNATMGNRIRKARNVHGYVVNPEIPWLFFNADRMINKGSLRLNLDGTMSNIELKDNCPLEIKTMSGFVSKKWDRGIPEYYVTQVHQQMLITGTDYSEVAVLMDGRQLKVFPIERNDSIIEMIVNKSTDFWARVLRGREALEKAKKYQSLGDDVGFSEQMGLLYSYEPEPDHNEGYKEYLSDRHKTEEEEMEGSDELLSIAKERQAVYAAIKELEGRKSELENAMRYEFVQNNTDKFIFPSNGYIRFYERKNSKSKVLSVEVPKPDKFIVGCELEKINLMNGYQ